MTFELLNLSTFKPLILAPLAGVTDSPFRRILKGLGADICFSEMISSEALVRNSSKTLALLKFDPSERPLIFQLFGANPRIMAEAARILSSLEIDGIDINCGCPDPKVLKVGAGGALLADLPRLRAILESVKTATSLPVSCKLRSGFDGSSFTALEAARMAQDLGLGAVTLHPRTVRQGFRGQADWEQIRELKERVEIPVIANGDVRQPPDVLRLLETTGADMVMIGRAAWENPWIFRQAKTLLESKGMARHALTPATEKTTLALEHARLLEDFYGPRIGLSLVPRFLCRYLKGFAGSSTLRKKISAAKSFDKLLDILSSYGHNVNRNSSPSFAVSF
jgi:tRNA-dihydrouridine synthase B